MLVRMTHELCSVVFILQRVVVTKVMKDCIKSSFCFVSNFLCKWESGRRVDDVLQCITMAAVSGRHDCSDSSFSRASSMKEDVQISRVPSR
ncbi:hypothetical protein IF2G_05830 [Cordyceps javanica]|nr:hypothetical protein IF2G_05830 [Cordyceps javanica]